MEFRRGRNFFVKDEIFCKLKHISQNLCDRFTKEKLSQAKNFVKFLFLNVKKFGTLKVVHFAQKFFNFQFCVFFFAEDEYSYMHAKTTWTSIEGKRLSLHKFEPAFGYIRQL